jgi:hypothetical protein
MVVWLPAFALLALLLVLATGLRVQRYSSQHVAARLTVAGRGIYFSRTPDGVWWKLRLRRHAPRCCWPDSDEDPPDGGVREPRRPVGPRPASAARVDLP